MILFSLSYLQKAIEKISFLTPTLCLLLLFYNVNFLGEIHHFLLSRATQYGRVNLVQVDVNLEEPQILKLSRVSALEHSAETNCLRFHCGVWTGL